MDLRIGSLANCVLFSYIGMGRNLINGDYSTILDFQSDVNMTFSFRMKYSKKGSKIYKMAKVLKRKFERGKFARDGQRQFLNTFVATYV